MPCICLSICAALSCSVMSDSATPWSVACHALPSMGIHQGLSRSQWPTHVKIFGTQRQPRARDFWGLVNFQERSWAMHAQFLLTHSPVILTEGREGSPAYDIMKLLPHGKGASQEALVVKNPSAKAGDADSIPGSGRSPEDEHSNSLQYSCLENPIDRGAWRSIGCSP